MKDGMKLIIGAVLVYFLFIAPGANKTPPSSDLPGTTPAPNGCAYQPTVSITGTDALVLSTAATPTTVNYIVNDVYLGTSAPAVSTGDKWTIVGDLANYLADVQTLTIGCGAQKIIAHPYPYANATVTVKDDPVSSANTLSQTGGSNNATAIPSGGQRNLGLIFQGTSQKSTGKIFWVVETPASSSSNVSTVTASCDGATLSNVAIPNGVTAANAASVRYAFEIPAVVGATSKTCNLQIQAATSKTLVGRLLNTFYAEQKFVDADGKVQEGIYDSTTNGNNAAKYESTYTAHVYIGNI